MNRNIPYQKIYKTDGEGVTTLSNPIKDRYISVLPNRKARRETEGRFFGNGKSTPLTVTKLNKFRRVRQRIRLKDGSIKTILHYIE